jgi:hypothetical protein
MSTETTIKKTDTTVANTILEQLGGGRFRVMTGANNFIASDDYTLTFRLPGTKNFVKDRINVVRIKLEPTDTYTVAFSRLYGPTMTTIREVEDVGVENLREIFTSVTGLETSLGTMGRKG